MNDNVMNKKVGAAMVFGGGIGGMEAALNLVESGIKVYLVENKSSIGGAMSQLDKTFPTNDCAMCTMGPRLVTIGRHKDIEIITLGDVEKIDCDNGNYTVTLNKKARYVNEEKCTGCGECVEKCPIEVLSDYNMGLATEKAIYRRYPQAIPSSFAINKLGQSPCRFACPAGQKAQGYIALIKEKRFEDAYKVVLRDNPFPSVCGRVCRYYCEEECSRKRTDESVSVMSLKRFIADWAFENRIVIDTEKLEENGKSVAIIGSGPAGLTAAKDLRELGYRVVVFESLPEPGGMMRYGIPDFRLPKERLDWDIQLISRNGIIIKTDYRVESIDELIQNGHNAVFIATGNHEGRKLRIPGADLPDVLVNVNFLRTVAMGEEVRLGESVLVIGGGNTAMDVARTAVRLGAKTVHVACLESRDKMPADPWEIEDAVEEGITIHTSRSFLEVLSVNSNISGVKCVKVKFHGFEEDGTPDIDLLEGTEHVIECDTVIFSIGQKPEIKFVDEGIELTRFGTIKVDEDTLATSKKGVFAGGDAVRGTKFVVDAIADGHHVARSIHNYLKGEELERFAPRLHKVELSDEEIILRLKNGEKRCVPAKTQPQERIKSFGEVQRGFSEEEAIKEAERCLNCGICSECLMCVEACQAEAIEHDMPKEEPLRLDVGAIILSPGYEIFDAKLKEELGYARYQNVLTALEFERILSPSGPYSGEVLRPSDGKVPGRIAFIQCVGSRDFERDYCSSVCCMYATKEAIIAKEHAGEELQCDIFFMDIRAFSKGFEAYFEKAKELGVNYIRCRIPSIEEVPNTGNLIIHYLEEDDRKTSREYDMVVLSVGMCPPKNVQEIEEKFGIELNEFNFCQTSVFKPVESGRDGVYVAGPFTEPKDIPETVMQASASASKVMSLLHDVRGSLIQPKEYPPELDVSGQEPRIGIFVCHCGTNIAGVVNVPEVVEYARTLPNLVYAENNLYSCSNDAQEGIKEKIKEHNLNRVVVASCTPRTHEPLFRNTIREAGLNPYLFEMANIRDQCSWVHMHEPVKATMKSKDLVRVAVAKARLLEPLQKGSVDVIKSALVIGGGLAGMTSALELANQGFDVYLVEKENELGGNLKNISYLFNGENPQEEIKILIGMMNGSSNIHVFTVAKIDSIEGSIGNFKTKITTNGEEKELEHGIVIVATGAKEYKPEEYLYGQDERVMTQLELEDRLMTSGERFLTNGKGEPKTVVMIQCVGSRDGERPYCSRLCCSEAVKNALKIKELSPGTHVYVLYRDVRTYGFRESYYTKARQKGVVFVRYDEDRKPEVLKGDDGLRVKAHDQILRLTIEIPSDLIVLSAGIIPQADNEEIAKLLKVPLNPDGFFLEAHMKLRPVEFAADGIFICGLAHSPKLIEESIIQAGAAAAKAGAILSRDSLELEANISHVVDENCDGCAYCIEPCPAQAITLIEYMWQGAVKKTVETNDSICKGCGSCMATCPKKGIYVRGFTLEQIGAQVEAALNATR
ncbi:MAG: FAD-dependent oxidoreductase [Planctomycetota bacterium]|jgi:heterodisulfide reductase subunit A-like polyferredoxin